MEKLASQVLQLDEVTYYYCKDLPIFNDVCISANMESRICIVSITTHFVFRLVVCVNFVLVG